MAINSGHYSPFAALCYAPPLFAAGPGHLWPEKGDQVNSVYSSRKVPLAVRFAASPTLPEKGHHSPAPQ